MRAHDFQFVTNISMTYPQTSTLQKNVDSQGGKRLFAGFPAPTSNTTYTPNQFFDVCLPYASRGTVRLVAFLIRKTLGWCDADGNPQQTVIQVSYRELEKDASINHCMAKQAVEEAIRMNLIQFTSQDGHPASDNHRDTPLLELKWHQGDYTKDPKKFLGFFSREGNRTFIPNAYFDELIPNEPLSVIKVVGVIGRNTIGFRNQYGFRRERIEMSYSDIQRQTRISSRRTLNNAIKQALSRNYIMRFDEGYFDKEAGRLSKPARYGLKWQDSRALSPFGVLTQPKSVYCSEKDTGSVLKRIPATCSKKDTDIERKQNKENYKQQQHPRSNHNLVVDPVVVSQLQEQGFSRLISEDLSSRYPRDQVLRQINWLKRRNPVHNRLGMLRRAIEQDWIEPQQELRSNEAAQRSGYIFASHFYAGYHQNQDDPVSIPSSNDIETGEVFVKRLLEFWPQIDQVSSWGRRFGEHVRRRTSDHTTVSLVLSLRTYGDEFYRQMKTQRSRALQEAEMKAKEKHQTESEKAYLDYLREEFDRMQSKCSQEYRAFQKRRTSERQKIEKGRFVFRRERKLEQFDSEHQLLFDFQKFFCDSVMEFWTWDQALNPTPYENQFLNPCKS